MLIRKSKLSKNIHNKLIEHFVARTTARCTASLLNINRNTVIYYYAKRHLIKYNGIPREDFVLYLRSVNSILTIKNIGCN